MNLLLTLSHNLLAWDRARTGIPNKDTGDAIKKNLYTHFAIKVSISATCLRAVFTWAVPKSGKRYAQFLLGQFPKVEKDSQVISIFLRFWDLCV